MSTYYDYREVGVMIAHKLMSMEGWKVYGYHADESDSMTDYYSPAYWNGVAEKNGYVFCFNVYGASEGEEIRKYNYEGFTYDNSIMEKIAKLERMTIENGASEAEEASAKASIERLQKKAEESNENRNKYVVIGHIPAHMEHPPKMNWHIEKDGIIIAKGNGVLKYANVYNYYNYSHYTEDMKAFKKDKKAYTEKHANDLFIRGYYSREKAQEIAESHAKDMENDLKLIDQFEAFINKIDTTCGSLLGEGDGVIYEKVTVTEYKKENKVVEDTAGSLKEGQLFVLKSNFNYGRFKGFTYKIHETTYEDGQKRYYAYKLNGKKTKECTGQANQANYWWIHDTEKFLKWFNQGAIAWCHIEEVKMPYEVEKVVRKTIKAEKKANTSTTTETTQAVQSEVTDVNSYTYEISEDTDTRTGEKIYLVKVAEKLSREEYITVNKYIKSLGGYYSRFKRAFLFKENPVKKLNVIMTNETTEEKEEVSTQKNTSKSINYIISEDTHTKTGETIWIVKPEKQLSKIDFAEVRRKLATLQGYYSSFVKGFIFKYDPTEKLESA